MIGTRINIDASFSTMLTLTAPAVGVGSDCGPLSTQTCVAITDVVAMVDLDFGSVPDNNETNDGGFLCVNDDDDDNNGTPDKDDASPTPGEDDLMPLTITADGAQAGTLTLSAVTGGNRIKVYENADRSNPVTLPKSWDLLGLPKSFSTVLYVEGIDTSLVLRDTELSLEAVLQNGDSCDDRVKLTVYSVTLDASPEPIPATTAWPAMPDYSFSEIAVEWVPADVPGTLEIAELVTDGYDPPDEGVLTETSPTEWLYDAFDEPQTEIHPKTVEVWIAAKVDGKECKRTRIRVMPIHNWWATPHRHNPDGQFHAPDVSDYTSAYDFIRWKYASVLNGIVGAEFRSVTIFLDACVECGFGFPPPCVAACTSPIDNVRFGTDTFSGSENRTASIIGHELVHTVGIGNQTECTAYTWEIDHQVETGIDQDVSYFQDVQQSQAEECD